MPGADSFLLINYDTIPDGQDMSSILGQSLVGIFYLLGIDVGGAMHSSTSKYPGNPTEMVQTDPSGPPQSAFQDVWK